MRRIFILFLAGFLTTLGSGQATAGSIVNSKHNLSSSGPGSVKSVTESEICIYCHIPHNASSMTPLWSRGESGQIYEPYTSTTSKASIGQPTGASKLCLSCHDGTVALGMVLSRDTEIEFTGPLSNEKNLGFDLSDDHPISFTYNASLVSLNPALKSPATLTGSVRLDHASQLQCTSCHNPHDDANGKFLVMNSANSALCLQCHNPASWPAALHNTSSKTFTGIPGKYVNPSWNTVSQYGCQSCHKLHTASEKERLLNYSQEENNCFTCHNGSVALRNISAEVVKTSAHRVGNTTGLHDPAESPLLATDRHVECTDCHNPHAANSSDTVNLPGSLRQVRGVNAAGSEINLISYEYELCFRCHADTALGTPYVNRQFPQSNTRLEFATSNNSYHPVEAPGKNSDVPSLISPLNVNSTIRCTSCHNNNAGPGAAGSGPNGPHGSIYAPLLERQQRLTDGLSESAANYALCYKCHSRDNILSDRSFGKHRKHIVEYRTACTACHDPHGVQSVNHLINFDLNIVSPDSSGRLRFDDLGAGDGRCYLTCHGEDHNPKTY